MPIRSYLHFCAGHCHLPRLSMIYCRSYCSSPPFWNPPGDGTQLFLFDVVFLMKAIKLPFIQQKLDPTRGALPCLRRSLSYHVQAWELYLSMVTPVPTLPSTYPMAPSSLHTRMCSERDSSQPLERRHSSMLHCCSYVRPPRRRHMEISCVLLLGLQGGVFHPSSACSYVGWASAALDSLCCPGLSNCRLYPEHVNIQCVSTTSYLFTVAVMLGLRLAWSTPVGAD